MVPGTLAKELGDELSQGLFQVELHELHSLQTVRLLFLRSPPTSCLKQRQVLTAPHSGEQLRHSRIAISNEKGLACL